MIGRGLVACRWWIGRFGRCDSGVTAIEYGLIAASIALAFLAIIVLLGDDIGSMFSNVSDAVQNGAAS